MDKNEFVWIGKILGPHGIRGAVRVSGDVEADSVFREGKTLYIKPPEGGERTHIIEWARPGNRFVLVGLKGIVNRDLAVSMTGADILIPRRELPELEAGTYYWSDIIGLSVFKIDGDSLGRVESIITTGSNDVYVVRDGNKETLVPALESIVTRIDLETGIMRVALPEGL